MKDRLNFTIDEVKHFLGDYLKDFEFKENEEEKAVRRLLKHHKRLGNEDANDEEMLQAIKDLNEYGIPNIFQWHYFELFYIYQKRPYKFEDFKQFNHIFEFLDTLTHLENRSGIPCEKFPFDLKVLFSQIRHQEVVHESI